MTYITGSLSGTNTTQSVCYSTVTLTIVEGRDVEVIFNGYGANSVDGSYVFTGFLMDGAFALGSSATRGQALYRSPANRYAFVGYTARLTNIAPGSHNFCLTAWTDGNTWSIINASTYGLFGVREHR
jgi:hypothetical protein